jgi:phospholipid/cholesterol/gamma-HCH transport system ATP-binding protein
LNSSDSLIDVRDVAFAYGERQILKGISLKIPRGKIVAILGASGSGKSTLLQLIGGQLTPSRGTITIGGEDVHRLSSHDLYELRRRIGMMFQAGGLFSDLSVFENIAFPLREHTKLSDELIRQIVLMKLHAVGLRGARNLMPAEVSGGMARRIALARAIALDPMLAMYDEPFAGLDPISLNVIAELIRRLNHALGSTSVVVSYDVKEAEKLADYIYVIGNGVVVGEGTPQELAASRDPFVRQFMDAKPDGPIAFHYPSRPFAAELGIETATR